MHRGHASKPNYGKITTKEQTKNENEETNNDKKIFLKRFDSDVNTWHILEKGEEKESKGLLMT